MNVYDRNLGFFTEALSARDPLVFGAIERELGRKRGEVGQIAEEDIVSRAGVGAQG